MKKIIILIVSILIITIYVNYTLIEKNTIKYVAPKSSTIEQAQTEIRKQIKILNNKDSDLSSKISVLESKREKIRKIKMSFSLALEQKK